MAADCLRVRPKVVFIVDGVEKLGPSLIQICIQLLVGTSRRSTEPELILQGGVSTLSTCCIHCEICLECRKFRVYIDLQRSDLLEFRDLPVSDRTRICCQA